MWPKLDLEFHIIAVEVPRVEGKEEIVLCKFRKKGFLFSIHFSWPRNKTQCWSNIVLQNLYYVFDSHDASFQMINCQKFIISSALRNFQNTFYTEYLQSAHRKQTKKGLIACPYFIVTRHYSIVARRFSNVT